MGFSRLNRSRDLDTLRQETFDVVIIGGGITGAGLALQTAASGMKTALLEMQDFSEGTSSRSTKLVHGGIRYLKQFDVEVVRDTVTERAVIQQIAPHIPRPAHMLIPLYDTDHATFSPFRLEVAMNLYDSLAGVPADSKWSNQMLSREEVLDLQPSLVADHLVGGGMYMDFTNNDSRLVIENVKQAVEDGALALSHVEVTGLEAGEEGRLDRALVVDHLTGEEFTVAGKVFVNTTGPWSDTIRAMDASDAAPAKMRPTKGVHLVVDGDKLPVRQTLYFDSGEGDGRMIFVIPREGKTYFGTTDTDYAGDLAEPRVTAEDVAYLLRIINRHFDLPDLSPEDVESSWAGLRPLIAGNQGSDYNGGDNGSMSDADFDTLHGLFRAYDRGEADRPAIEQHVRGMASNRSELALDPSQVSRGSELTVSPAGLLTVAGGKITDYRKMAAGAMKKIQEIFLLEGESFTAVDSMAYPVSGGHFAADDVDGALADYADQAEAAGLSAEASEALAQLYGSNLPRVLTYLDRAQAYAEDLDVPLGLTVSLLYAIHEEAVYSISDYLTRRTRLSHFHNEVIEPAFDGLVAILSRELGLSPEEAEAQADAYREEYAHMHLAHLND